MASTTRRPRISIGLPVYNGERYIRLALDSLLAQTFGDFELIISDNASTDTTEAICREYAARDRRIRYLRQPENVGVVRNFNLLVEQATAPFFKWASADDLIMPDLLERCLAVIEQDESIVLAHCRTRYIDADGNEIVRADPGLHIIEERPSERVFKLWSTLTYCNAQYGIMRIDALRRTALFGGFVGADVCFLAELVLHGKFFEVSDPLLLRRLHREAASGLTAEELLEHYGFRRGKLVLYYWRHFYENVRSTLRAPAPPAEKRRVLAMIARRMVWQRAALTQEIGFLIRHMTGRRYRPLGSIERFSRPESDRLP